MAMSKQSYYDMSTMLLKVAVTMPDALVKTKVQHRHKLYIPVTTPGKSEVSALLLLG